MTTKKKYRNVAFLAELLINILVFSISCAILVALFGKAGEMARNTKEESLAGAEVLALVEEAKAGGAEALMAKPNCAGTSSAAGQGVFLLYYDKNWQPAQTADETQPYYITLTIQQEDTAAGALVHLGASAYASQTPTEGIYTVTTSVYFPGEGGANL